jgi:ElaB/YqjD/DUF883 family membrane-anchored ribosome-binding protein
MNTTRDQIDAESRKDPERLEREIDQQRDTIGNIVSALENKLSPGEIVDRVMRASNSTGGEFARNLGNVVRANPMPTLLTTAGLVWLYASRRDSAPVHEPAPAYGSTYATTGATSTSSGYAKSGEDHGSGEGLKDKASHLKEGASERVSHLKDGISERASSMREGASHLRDNASHKWSDAKDRVGETAHNAADSMRHQADRARQGFSHLMEDNPLVIGAIALGVGALLGAALPTTRKEDELMGETGDKLRSKAGEAKDAVREKGREVAQSAREKGKETAREIRDDSSSSTRDSTGQGYSASPTTGGTGSTSTQGLGATSTPGSTTGSSRTSV